MARDQRTRLNAELAEQYGAANPARAPAAPGRTSLANETTPETALAGDAVAVEVEHADHEQQPEQQSEQDEQLAHEAQPKKSVFELPRRASSSTRRE